MSAYCSNEKGEYTHAAVWLAMALARLGDGEKAVELLRFLNPVERTRTPARVERYRAEPYAVAADVCTRGELEGRGGWTWYTGSAGWMYRVWLGEVLGVKREGKRLRLAPALPPDWTCYTVSYLFGRSTYEIMVEKPLGIAGRIELMTLDDRELPNGYVPLVDDGGQHLVRVRLYAAGETWEDGKFYGRKDIRY